MVKSYQREKRSDDETDQISSVGCIFGGLCPDIYNIWKVVKEDISLHLRFESCHCQEKGVLYIYGTTKELLWGLMSIVLGHSRIFVYLSGTKRTSIKCDKFIWVVHFGI